MIAKTADIGVTHVKCTPNEITLTWENETYSVYQALWLRDNDPANRDARTGQRLISLLDLPREPRLVSAQPEPTGHLTLHWEDGPTTVFPLAWLRAFNRSLRMGPRPVRLPWVGNPAAAFARCDYGHWMESATAREDWLYYAGRDGLAFLTGVPIEDGAAQRIADLIGFVRETNYGSIFDVRSMEEPNNLAYTSQELPVRTDNPYRDPVPGFKMLHCLCPAEHGGESMFVDGLAVAEQIRARDADAFDLLSQTPVLFRFQDAAVDLVAERTMLDLDTMGQFRAIYYNDRSIEPLPLKGPKLKKYYPAYRRLVEMVRDPARLVTARLEPGDLVLFDNTRILHGRTAFYGGSRHLQGCYLDADGLYSKLAVHTRDRNAHHVQRHD
jgi:alpha-ketoglutarate-dependent taurine dioxygenase